MRVVKRLAKESQAALARAGAVAQEGLANQRVVRSFGAEGFEVGRYAHAVGDPDAAERPAKDSSLALGLRQAGVQAAFITTTAALGYASVLGVWYYGGLLVVRGQKRRATSSTGRTRRVNLITTMACWRLKFVHTGS